MNITDARILAHSLILEHLDTSWSVGEFRSKKVFGRCRYFNRVIELSKPLCELNDEKTVRNVILHEIAHALVGYAHGHDYVWQQKHIELGGNGRRHSTDVYVQFDYVGICPNNHKVYSLGKPRRKSSCNICNPGRYSEEYGHSWLKSPVVKKVSEIA